MCVYGGWGECLRLLRLMRVFKVYMLHTLHFVLGLSYFLLGRRN